MYSDKINQMVWSYSRLSAYVQCKYQFYLKYIVNDNNEYLQEGNYYAEVGSYVHSILEMVFNNKLDVEEAAQYFVDHYDDNVFYMAKKSTMDKTFELCATYFANLSLEWLKGFHIIGVEKEINISINGYRFTGFIDLLLQDKETGDYIVVDHKSAKYPLSKKNKKVLKASEASFESYKKQMYLYARAVKEEYGVFPRWIVWNHFKDQEIVRIPFEEHDYDKSIKWFTDTIHDIEQDTVFEESQDFFYCHNLCEFRHSCEYARYYE